MILHRHTSKPFTANAGDVWPVAYSESAITFVLRPEYTGLYVVKCAAYVCFEAFLGWIVCNKCHVIGLHLVGKRQKCRCTNCLKLTVNKKQLFKLGSENKNQLTICKDII